MNQTEITTDQKLAELLDMTNNIGRYIKYYKPEPFEVIEDEAYITYDRVVDFVLSNSIIVNKKYTPERFDHFFFHGLSEDDEVFKETKMSYEDVKRDLDVTRQEINYIYILKNWEIDKNIYSINIEDGDLPDDIAEPNFLHEAFHNTMMCELIPSYIYDSLLFFKEANDCHIVTAGVTYTPDLEEKALLFFIFSGNENSENNKDHPYMVLSFWVDTHNGASITEKIEEAFSENYKKKYDEFMTKYENLSILIGKIVAGYANGYIKELSNNKDFYKPADVTNIKNQYKEIYQVSLESL